MEEEVKALRERNASLGRDVSFLKKRLEKMETEGRRDKRRALASDSSPSPPRRRHLSSSTSEVEVAGGSAFPPCPSKDNKKGERGVMKVGLPPSVRVSPPRVAPLTRTYGGSGGWTTCGHS